MYCIELKNIYIFVMQYKKLHMNTNQIYIKHLFILKWILVLIGLTSIAICVNVSTGSISRKNNSIQKSLYNVDSIELKSGNKLNEIGLNILNE